MLVKVYGYGCEKHDRLYKNAIQAANQMDLEANVIKILDNEKIAEAGFNYTPGLAIDDEPLVAGRVLTVDELKILFRRYQKVVVG